MKQVPNILCLLAFLLCNIHCTKFMTKENGGKQALKEYYRLPKDSFCYSNFIDTTQVYIAEFEYVITNWQGKMVKPLSKYYKFIRFSNSGLAFSSALSLRPYKNEDFNIMDNGQYCFYKLDGAYITLETYNFDIKQFQYRYGLIQENGNIIFFKSKGLKTGTESKLNDTFIKTPANLTSSIEFPLDTFTKDDPIKY